MKIQPNIITCIFYCLITYNSLHVFSLHVKTRLLHIFLNVMESRKQVPGPAHTSQWVLTDLSRRSEQMQMGNSWNSLLTEGNTGGVLVSDDSVPGHTLGYTE